MNSHGKNRNYKICVHLAIQFFIIAISSFSLIPSFVYAQSANIKWHPGHYMRFKDYHSQDLMKTFLSNQYAKGIEIQIAWKEVEPKFDSYDFTKIDELLNLATSYNKYFMLHVETACFNAICTDGQAPTYLRTDSKYNGGVEVFRTRGSSVRMWDAAVVDRLVKLIEKIGERYDDNPNFVAFIMPNESALAIETGASDYSAQNYETQLLRIASTMSSVMPKTMGLIGINYFPRASDLTGVFTRIAEHLEKTGRGGLTHPDTIPGDASLPFYQVEEKFSNRIPIVPHFMTFGLSPSYSEEDLYLFATKTLGAQFVVWNNHWLSQYGGDRPNYITNYVFPIMNKYKGQVAGTLPASLAKTNTLDAPKLTIIAND